MTKPVKKQIVAHFVQDYLIATTNWIYGQMRANPDFTPIVLTKHVVNENVFPVERLYATDRLTRWQRACDTLTYRTLGYNSYFARSAQDASLIHAHFGHIGFKALGLTKKLRIPLVTSFYGYDVSALGRQARYQRRFQKLFAEGRLFLAEGPHLAKAIENLGCPAEKIKIFHLGVDINPLPKAIARKDDSVRVLFAATFTDKKGWPDALRAFANAAQVEPHLRLRLIGGGEDEAKVTALIQELDREFNITKHIERSGYVSHDELLREMQISDIFLQPSRTASNGNTEGGAPVTLIDAQSVGLAICATAHADIPEVAPHEISALLSPERDIEALTKNLLRLAHDSELRRRLGFMGRKRIETEYNWAIQGPRLAEIYRSALHTARV